VAGLATATAQGAAAAVYHLVGHALFKALLFLIAGAVVHATGATRLPELAGLARRNPGLVAMFLVGAAAIAGVPPLNGYVSLGLLHTAMLSGHEPVALAVVAAAQVATVAAMTRALRAMFARATEPGFARDERHRPGMAVALGALAVACVATGVAAQSLLGRVVEPAAAALHDGAGWAAAVLAGDGRVSSAAVHFRWIDPFELALTAGTVVVGVAASALVRPRADRLRERLAAVANGSVNDYALYLAGGLLVVCAAFLAWP
jgi:multicomponent Na+:H+ antiporter subunit D